MEVVEDMCGDLLGRSGLHDHLEEPQRSEFYMPSNILSSKELERLLLEPVSLMDLIKCLLSRVVQDIVLATLNSRNETYITWAYLFAKQLSF